LTPTRQPLKFLDDPEQLFMTPPRPLYPPRYIFAQFLALCIRRPPLLKRGQDFTLCAKTGARMSSPEDQFKISLNQNLWGLVVGLAAMGAAEHYNLRTLFWFSVVVSVIMVLSLGATTLAYTIKYWKNKQG